MRIADPWPMNPDGEFLFGLKIENPRADANVETSVRVPGIAFAEWGPGDHGFYLMGRPGTYQGGGEASPADGGGAAPCAQCHQGGGDQVPQCLQREQRDRPDQGRHDDLHGRRLAGRGQGPRLHQAHRSLVI